MLVGVGKVGEDKWCEPCVVLNQLKRIQRILLWREMGAAAVKKLY